MNTAQQVIKALAIALAVLIIGGMISGIAIAGMTLSYVFDGRSSDDFATTVVEGVYSDTDANAVVTEVRIKTEVASLLIMSGDKLEVKTTSDCVDTYRSGQRLEVREKSRHFWEHWGSDPDQIVVVLPSDLELDVFTIETGAGRVEIGAVSAKQVSMSLGAGKTEITQLVASERVKIDSGVGHLIVRESKLHNLDLDMGVGAVEVQVELSGTNQIDAGVGKLALSLVGGMDKYQFKVEKGLGSVTLNGNKLGGDVTEGNGDTVVDIDGGVGAIQIRTN